jgi:hypothetical protein
MSEMPALVQRIVTVVVTAGLIAVFTGGYQFLISGLASTAGVGVPWYVVVFSALGCALVTVFALYAVYEASMDTPAPRMEPDG